MRENIAISAMCATLLIVSVWGGAVDVHLAAKAERQAKVADIIGLGAAECIPAPAMVYNYSGCTSKAYQTRLYYTARVESLTQN